MKKKSILYLVVIIVFAIGCSSDKHEHGLPYIDISKNYPKKEIILTDIADINYLCINSDDDEYLYKGFISCVTKNTIVIIENRSGKILFFTKDGKPKSYFNNKGQGPEEYTGPSRVLYDEAKDEAFVYTHFSNFQVYTSSGEYKRTIVLPKETALNSIFSFDEESLFLYDAIHHSPNRKRVTTDKTSYPVQNYNTPFVRISKVDGKVLDYVELPSNNIELWEGSDPRLLTHHIISCSNGLLLCNPETDTVFLYSKEKALTPVICKTPLVTTLDPKVILNNCMDYGNYQYIEIGTARYTGDPYNAFPLKYFMRDKKTGEVFLQKIILPDYKGKDFVISPRTSGHFYEDGTYFELDLIELKKAYIENRLSGKLKELVSTLDEEKDNDVIMFVHFKKD